MSIPDQKRLAYELKIMQQKEHLKASKPERKVQDLLGFVVRVDRRISMDLTQLFWKARSGLRIFSVCVAPSESVLPLTEHGPGAALYHYMQG